MTDEERSEPAQILNLLMPTFTGGKDEFARDVAPPLPLAFDRVNEGRPVSSNYPPLQKLPFELLSDIVEYFDAADLASLALVDRDCRQLARSVQFASVRFTFSPGSIMLVHLLLQEGELRSRGQHIQYPLGPCVRRLTVASEGRYITEVTGLTLTEDTGPEVRDLKRKAWSTYHLLLSSLSCVVAYSLTNLECLEFNDFTPMPPMLVQVLSSSPLRHLCIDRFSITQLHDASISSAYAINGNCWSGIQTLRISVSMLLLISRNESPVLTGRLIYSILLHVAPSCEDLALEGLAFTTAPPPPINEFPTFPRLRKLHLDHCRVSSGDDDSPLLRLLLPLDGTASRLLQHLQIDEVGSQYLKQLGYMPNLTKLIFNGCPSDANCGFIAVNPQLENLAFKYSMHASILEDQLLPVISAPQFSSLKALYLVFGSESISIKALSAISLISSLEMLWLSAGEQSGWRHNWFIDHEELQEELKGLQRLRSLAFSRDSYQCEGWRDSRDEISLGYYVVRLFPPGDDLEDYLALEDDNYLNSLPPLDTEFETQQRRRNYAWEIWHEANMRNLAEEYVELFPRLSFVFLGQYPYSVVIEELPTSQRREVVKFSEERDSCLTMLQRKWGIKSN
ncbi:hypothetical protein DFH11DRAFT_1596745 [Phellopilus nigrolimitatus]|nr:hypothetical protein DFH11DRAFT_1596745 [Phellopilus nigrolimitatus]